MTPPLAPHTQPDPVLDNVIILLSLIMAGLVLLFSRYPVAVVAVGLLLVAYVVWRDLPAWRDFKQSSLWLRLAALVGWLALATLCGSMRSVTRTFREVFVSFGAGLPSATQVFIDWGWVAVVVPVFISGLWLKWPGLRPTRGIAIVCWVLTPCLAGSAALLGYLPIWQLGSPVS